MGRGFPGQNQEQTSAYKNQVSFADLQMNNQNRSPAVQNDFKPRTHQPKNEWLGRAAGQTNNLGPNRSQQNENQFQMSNRKSPGNFSKQSQRYATPDHKMPLQEMNGNQFGQQQPGYGYAGEEELMNSPMFSESNNMAHGLGNEMMKVDDHAFYVF